DYIRMVEPSYERHDTADYLRRIKGRLPKLRRAAELFAREHRPVSDHTNNQKASGSPGGGGRPIAERLGSGAPPPSPLGQATAGPAEEGELPGEKAPPEAGAPESQRG